MDKGRLRVFFYHTEDVGYILEQWRAGKFPAHLLYGAAKLAGEGIDVVWHYPHTKETRWRKMLRTAWQLLTVKGGVDAVYATHYQGMEIIIMLRALRLFRRPVIAWIHQPIIIPEKKWRDRLGRLFYKGFDRMVFFSRDLIDTSLRTRKIRREPVVLGHWGADLAYYDSIMEKAESRRGFISTGKEMRDMKTLVAAFNAEKEQLDIYTGKRMGGVNYEEALTECQPQGNITVHYGNVMEHRKLSLLVARAACVVICCMETSYTVGLTTLVEAMALGIPVICSRNPHFPFDIDAERCGLTVPYYDVEGWRRAIRAMADNPSEAVEMGRRGRALAERMFNDNQCAKEMAQVIKEAVAETGGRHT